MSDADKLAHLKALQEGYIAQVAATASITKVISPPKIERSGPPRKRKISGQCKTMAENIDMLQARDDEEQAKEAAKEEKAEYYKPLKELFQRLGYMDLDSSRVTVAVLKTFMAANGIPVTSTMKKQDMVDGVKNAMATPPVMGFVPVSAVAAPAPAGAAPAP